MLKKILKTTTVLTTLAFAPLTKANASLAGADEIEEILKYFEEEDALSASTEESYTVLPENIFSNSVENVEGTGSVIEMGENETYITETQSTDAEYVVPVEEKVTEAEVPVTNAEEGQALTEDVLDDLSEAIKEVNQQETTQPETGVSIEEINSAVEEESFETTEENNTDITEVVEEMPETKGENAVSESEEVQSVAAPVSAVEESKMPEENKSEKSDIPVFPAALFTLAVLGSAFFAATKINECLKQKEQKLLEALQKDSRKMQAQKEAQQEKKAAEKLPENSKEIAQPQPTPVVINITVNEVDEKSNHQKAVRLLAQNKAKRAVLTRQKRALVLEQNNPNTTEERKLKIKQALDEIAFERKELSQARREACRLYKGKKGEALQEQRRLYAKKMRQLHRLMQKDGLPHLEEINEINAVREAIKQEEKHMMLEAKNEMNMRAERANWLHGIRSLKDVQAKQKNFENKITKLKKETGLKKKEVLASDDALWHEQKQIEQEKRNALRLVKGRTFTSQRSVLTKQLKLALAENNKELIQKISEEYADIKVKEKQFIENAKTFDYEGQRICMINGKTADRILRYREEAEKARLLDKQKRKRLAKANFLRGQRMLYQLSRGLVPSVNENRMTPQAYKKEALKLIGSKKVHYLYQQPSYQKA